MGKLSTTFFDTGMLSNQMSIGLDTEAITRDQLQQFDDVLNKVETDQWNDGEKRSLLALSEWLMRDGLKADAETVVLRYFLLNDRLMQDQYAVILL